MQRLNFSTLHRLPDWRLDWPHPRSPLSLAFSTRSILDLNLDSPLRRVRSDMERIYRLLKWEPMSDEGLEIDQATRDQSESFRVLLKSARVNW
jgi:hypothetical protein